MHVLLCRIAKRPQFYTLTKDCVQLLIKRLLLPSFDYDKVIKGKYRRRIPFYPFDSAPNASLASLHSARYFIFDLFFICFKLNLHFVAGLASLSMHTFPSAWCQKIFNKTASCGHWKIIKIFKNYSGMQNAHIPWL